MADMDLPSSEESEEEVDNKHRGAEADDVPLTQKIRVRRQSADDAETLCMPLYVSSWSSAMTDSGRPWIAYKSARQYRAWFLD